MGLIPLEAMRRAGRFYLEKQGASVGVPEPVLVETAIQSLGLRELGGFDPMQKIIEYRVANDSPLASSSVREFVDLVSTDAPVPGGGSVAALCGSLAAALTAMVANLTVGKKGYESVSSEMSTLAAQAQSLKDEFLRAVDEDARAFDAVMVANRMPKATHDEHLRRDEAIQAATKRAIDAPLAVIHLCAEGAAAGGARRDEGQQEFDQRRGGGRAGVGGRGARCVAQCTHQSSGAIRS